MRDDSAFCEGSEGAHVYSSTCNCQSCREGQAAVNAYYSQQTTGYVNCYYHHGGNLPCPEQTNTGH
jgi:hypothetical protein